MRLEPAAVLPRFQAALRHHRQAAGLSLRAMAAQMEQPWQNLQRMETGPHVPRLTTAVLIAQFFGKDISAFLEDGDTKTVDR